MNISISNTCQQEFSESGSYLDYNLFAHGATMIGFMVMTWPRMTHWWITLDDHKVHVILWNILGLSFRFASRFHHWQDLHAQFFRGKSHDGRMLDGWGGLSKSPAEKATGKCSQTIEVFKSAPTTFGVGIVWAFYCSSLLGQNYQFGMYIYLDIHILDLSFMQCPAGNFNMNLLKTTLAREDFFQRIPAEFQGPMKGL